MFHAASRGRLTGLLLPANLRKRKIRDQVPITHVTPEPYIGLGGVGDSKGMLESELRNRHINWITNTKRNEGKKGTMENIDERYILKAPGSEKLR